MEKNYCYFFTAQNMSAEQQLVQTAHVALKLGVLSTRQVAPVTDVTPVGKFDPDNTYFTVIGVRNEDALLAVKLILDKFGYQYETFYEPDQEQVTSIALYPILESQRGPLMAFNLLKM